MSRPTVYVAITNHGFGHATRTASVVAEIQKRNPEILIILVTTAPRWLLESYISGEFIYRPRALDVGIVQSDSLTMDKVATLAKWQEIRDRQDQLIASEVEFIRQNQVDLVLADIPPLAAAIAQVAGIPCWMMSNFGWDFIYRPWGGGFLDLADWIQTCFQKCDRLFRLPFHETMPAFANIEDVGLTGGTPRYSPLELRAKLELETLDPATGQTVLLTFGGLGLDQVPYTALADFPQWQFLTLDSQAPDLPNLKRITGHHFRPVDLMPLCNRIVSKPGYSTFAEACRLQIPVTSITREDFAETALLLAGLQDYADHQIVPAETFFQGRWEFLEERPIPRRSATSLDCNGHETIAEALVDYFRS